MPSDQIGAQPHQPRPAKRGQEQPNPPSHTTRGPNYTSSLPVLPKRGILIHAPLPPAWPLTHTAHAVQYMPYARTHTHARCIHRARPILHPLSFHFGRLVSPFPSFMIHSNQTYPKSCLLIITNPVGVQSRSVHTSSSLVSTFVLSIIPRSTPNSRWFHLSSDCHWEPLTKLDLEYKHHSSPRRSNRA